MKVRGSTETGQYVIGGLLILLLILALGSIPSGNQPTTYTSNEPVTRYSAEKHRLKIDCEYQRGISRLDMSNDQLERVSVCRLYGYGQ